MSVKSRLDKLYKTCQRIKLDPSAKILFISDLHESDGGPADDYKKNEAVFIQEVSPYFDAGYTLVILGDRYDLWECPDINKIFSAHPETEALINRFSADGRLFEVWGNHDNRFKSVYHEALVLQIGDIEIFCNHGHPGDIWNDKLWWIGQNIVRYLWVPLQWIGLHDAQVAKKKRHELQEFRLMEWADRQKFISIFGHTHLLANVKCEINYLNTGSWVNKGSQAIEYSDGTFKERRFV